MFYAHDFIKTKPGQSNKWTVGKYPTAYWRSDCTIGPEAANKTVFEAKLHLRMQRILEILLLEDNEDDVVLIGLELQRSGLSFHMQHVGNEKDFIAALKAYAPEIIL